MWKKEKKKVSTSIFAKVHPFLCGDSSKIASPVTERLKRRSIFEFQTKDNGTTSELPVSI
jgi:hypothetical protein